MSYTTLSPSTSDEFLNANKDAFVVLFFDAKFTDSLTIVESAINSLNSCEELKDKVVVAYVDVEANNDLASRLQVVSVPMVICQKQGRIVKKIDTLEPTKLLNIIKEQLKLYELEVTGDSEGIVDPKETFKAYLKNLTTRAPVMIFMKGDPKTPRCGFSRQLVELLTKHDIKYDSFDILQDEEVRQKLKEYSDWPTYPQIYVKGEFVGGLDILKQMEESGELESTLKA